MWCAQNSESAILLGMVKDPTLPTLYLLTLDDIDHHSTFSISPQSTPTLHGSPSFTSDLLTRTPLPQYLCLYTLSFHPSTSPSSMFFLKLASTTYTISNSDTTLKLHFHSHHSCSSLLPLCHIPSNTSILPAIAPFHFSLHASFLHITMFHVLRPTSIQCKFSALRNPPPPYKKGDDVRVIVTLTWTSS